MKNTHAAFSLLVALWSLSLTASAAVSARLDPTQVGPGEAVQLILQHDGQTDSQPDLGPLKQDFDVLGRSTGSSIQIINGKMSAQTEINLTLMPKHGGKLQVPALQWDGQTTPALALTVSGNSAGAQPGNVPAGGSAHVFLTTTLDQKQPYVQAAATLTVRLYTDEPLYQASLELQPSNDVLVQQLGQDSQTSATRDGRTYHVIERKYLLFPQRSGPIRLDGPVLNAEVPDARGGNDPFGANAFFGNVFGRNPFGGMMNATRPLRVRADPLVLNVRPRPASGTGHDWLPAQKVTLAETWQPDNGPLHVGDPITRHLHLSALGLTAVPAARPERAHAAAGRPPRLSRPGQAEYRRAGRRRRRHPRPGHRADRQSLRPLSNSRAPSVLVGYHPQPAARSRIAGAHPVCPAQCRRGRRRDHAPGPGWRHAAIAG